MTVNIEFEPAIATGDTDWADEAEAQRTKRAGNFARLKAAVEGLLKAVPVQKIKSGASTYSPDADGIVTLPGGVVAPATTTTQRDAISAPTVGQVIYNTTNARIEGYTATGWQPGIPTMTSAQRQALPAVVGLMVFDTTDMGLYTYVSGGWIRVGSCRIDVFTASGTWAKPLGVKYVDVVCIGGGAGGTNNSATRAGGGGGGYARQMVVASALPASVSVTVGVGGAGGVGGGALGSPGTPSSFGDMVGADGGLTSNITAPGGAATGTAPLQVASGTRDTDSSRGGTGNVDTPGALGAPYGGGAGGYGGSAVSVGGTSGQLAGGAAGGSPGQSRSGTGLAGSGGGGANNTVGGAGGIPGGGGGTGQSGTRGGEGGRGEVIVVSIF